MKSFHWMLGVLSLALVGSLARAGEEPPARAWPLWDGSESIAAYAKRANLPPTKTLDLGGGVELELVLIPAGKFLMGTPKPESVWIGRGIVIGGGAMALALLVAMVVGMVRRRSWRPQFSLFWFFLFTLALSIASYGGVRWWQAEQARARVWGHDEKPGYEAALTQPFYMGKYEVTQEQYQKVMGYDPSNFKGPKNPVEMVCWLDANEFCDKASRATGKGVRLPTEAEWEYACRAGTRTRFNTGDRVEDLDKVGWYDGNSNGQTHPVGQKAANVWGLYDMHGNVWEWCADWYGEYPKRAVEDPQGAAEGSSRVIRGGSWYNNNPRDCHSATRLFCLPYLPQPVYGFRVVVVVPRTP